MAQTKPNADNNNSNTTTSSNTNTNTNTNTLPPNDNKMNKNDDNNDFFVVPMSSNSKPQTKDDLNLMAKKREEIMAERNAKLQQRMAAMAARRMKRTANRGGNKQQKQAMQTFLNSFTSEYDKIENDIILQKTHQQFKQLKLRTFDLEKKLADNAAILPSYTFEAKNRMMTNLKNKINIKQQEIAPKPKFKFKNQKIISPTTSPIKINPNKSVIATDDIKDDDDASNNALKLIQASINEIKIENKKSETINMKNGSINGSDICLSNLTTCTVSLCDNIGALRMNNISHCNIICGPISSSLHIEYINNSTIHAAMRQCRIHYCNNTKFYIHCNSEPVIEHSDNVQFAPYSVKYKDLTINWNKSGIDKNINKWNKVKDFNWFKQKQSPHWSIIPDISRLTNVQPQEESDEDEL